jgi:hypothetical protein
MILGLSKLKAIILLLLYYGIPAIGLIWLLFAYYDAQTPPYHYFFSTSGYRVFYMLCLVVPLCLILSSAIISIVHKKPFLVLTIPLNIIFLIGMVYYLIHNG